MSSHDLTAGMASLRQHRLQITKTTEALWETSVPSSHAQWSTHCLHQGYWRTALPPLNTRCSKKGKIQKLQEESKESNSILCVLWDSMIFYLWHLPAEPGGQKGWKINITGNKPQLLSCSSEEAQQSDQREQLAILKTTNKTILPNPGYLECKWTKFHN